MVADWTLASNTSESMAQTSRQIWSCDGDSVVIVLKNYPSLLSCYDNLSPTRSSMSENRVFVYQCALSTWYAMDKYVDGMGIGFLIRLNSDLNTINAIVNAWARNSVVIARTRTFDLSYHFLHCIHHLFQLHRVALVGHGEGVWEAVTTLPWWVGFNICQPFTCFLRLWRATGPAVVGGVNCFLHNIVDAL